MIHRGRRQSCQSKDSFSVHPLEESTYVNIRKTLCPPILLIFHLYELQTFLDYLLCPCPSLAYAA